VSDGVRAMVALSCLIVVGWLVAWALARRAGRMLGASTVAALYTVARFWFSLAVAVHYGREWFHHTWHASQLPDIRGNEAAVVRKEEPCSTSLRMVQVSTARR
jgi:hypothetical protein